jgi:hypothetical protein
MSAIGRSRPDGFPCSSNTAGYKYKAQTPNHGYGNQSMAGASNGASQEHSTTAAMVSVTKTRRAVCIALFPLAG